MFATFYRKGREGATIEPVDLAPTQPPAATDDGASSEAGGGDEPTPSRYNAVYPVDAQHAVIVNTVSGAVDVISRELADRLGADDDLELDEGTFEYLSTRGYIWQSGHDEAAVIRKLGQQIRDEVRRESPLKLLLIPTYRCNLSCSYCWQQPHVKEYWKDSFDDAMADAAFASMDRLYELKKQETSYTELQLFGGEPLLPNVRPLVERAVLFAEERGWRPRVTTNGMGLKDYAGFFADHPPFEIQISVDGPPDILRIRRRGADFERIAAGIEQLLFYGQTHINMRVNLDLANVEALPELANILIDRKWYTNPKFSTYIAPTRDEDFDKRAMYDKRVPLLQRYLEIRREYPQIEIFQVQGWTGFKQVKLLAETGRMPAPTFQSCDANLHMYVFDARGQIYACNEGNGDSDRAVGRFWPDFQLDEERLGFWRLPIFLQRDTCRNCNLAPMCGGGCAISETHSAYHEGYCRDVKATFEHAMVDYARQSLSQ